MTATYYYYKQKYELLCFTKYINHVIKKQQWECWDSIRNTEVDLQILPKSEANHRRLLATRELVFLQDDSGPSIHSELDSDDPWESDNSIF